MPTRALSVVHSKNMQVIFFRVPAVSHAAHGAQEGAAVVVDGPLENKNDGLIDGPVDILINGQSMV